MISIAKKYSKSPAQIALKYLLNKGIAVIPKSSNENRMKENLNLFDFELKDEDIKMLESLDTGRGRSWPSTMSEEFYKV